MDATILGTDHNLEVKLDIAAFFGAGALLVTKAPTQEPVLAQTSMEEDISMRAGSHEQNRVDARARLGALSQLSVGDVVNSILGSLKGMGCKVLAVLGFGLVCANPAGSTGEVTVTPTAAPDGVTAPPIWRPKAIKRSKDIKPAFDEARCLDCCSAAFGLPWTTANGL